MASFRASLMRTQIALLNPLLRRMDVKAVRKLQDALGVLGVRVLTDNVTYRDEAFADFSAAWAQPPHPRPGRAILYLHGGAYTAGSLRYARLFGGVLAEKLDCRVLCAGYRLAPENPYPAALEDAFRAYQRLLESYSPGEIDLVGESAGGGLCFCLALKIREAGLAMPRRIAALSPWTDLAMTGDFSRQEAKDPLLSAENLRYSASLYAGEDLLNPLVSPLYGDLSGLPPAIILAGSDEILLSDSERMAARLREFGRPCELHIAPEMWHVYPLYGIPEGREALERIRGFLSRENEEAADDEGLDAGVARLDQA